jgi:thiol-disulfide isomerase/thioredoxin
VRRLLVLLTTLLLAQLMLAGCSEAPTPRHRAMTTGVDVDTPQLRAQKRAAGVQGCAPGDASNDLPDVTLPCLGGGRDVDLRSLRGPMVINLFAQWCGPCRKELPYYQALHRNASGRVAVLGVDYLDTQPSAALELARESGVTYPLVADPSGRLRSDLRIRGLPGIVFLDRSGKVAGVEFRSVRSYAELRHVVHQELGVRVPA